MNLVEFTREVYEIAFGTDALNKDYSHEDVLQKLREKQRVPDVPVDPYDEEY